MSLDPKLFYNVMACAYRNGVLRKFTILGGEATVKVMAEYGLDMEDFIDLVNEMQEWKLQVIDRLLSIIGPLFKLATFDPLLKLLSRMLNLTIIKRITLEIIKINLKIFVIWKAPPSLSERLDSIFVGRVT